MLKNYFKTAWRSLIKDKLHSFINIIGLSIGMAVAVLIGLWMYDELSFNKSFKNYDHIAQVIQNVSNNGEVQTWWSVPYPLANELRTHYGSDFKHIAMAVDWHDHKITISNAGGANSTGNKVLKSNGGFFEKEMPEMFTLDMLQGGRNVLKDPSSVLISASASKAFFGNENAMGKVLKIDQFKPLKIAGIYENFPQNSTLAKLDFIASWDFWYHSNNDLKDMPDPWRPNFITLFAQINDNANFSNVSAKIKDAKLNKVNEQLQKKETCFVFRTNEQMAFIF